MDSDRIEQRVDRVEVLHEKIIDQVSIGGHGPGCGKGGHILERVRAGEKQVGAQPLLDGAGHLAQSEQPGIGSGGGTQCLGGESPPLRIT